ncbi:MAG: hypothetical protein GX202_09440 [Firmicutes bacterium]|nr:hypothetical protein [Bacillota bacterium]
MWSFMQNPWVVGIGGGIVCGIIVTLITRYIFSKRERKEYRQRIEKANNEILYSIRTVITEKMFPSVDVINSLLTSTARKYNVYKDDLYTIENICDDLIKEIMGNTFLSSEQKAEFCDLVSRFSQTQKGKEGSVDDTVIKRRGSSPEYLSLIAGLIAALTVITSILIENFEDTIKLIIPNDKLPIFILSTAIPIISVWFVTRISKEGAGRSHKNYDLLISLIDNDSEPPSDKESLDS